MRRLLVPTENDGPTRWSWIERTLNPTEDHFSLHYGSAEEQWDNWTLVARVGPPDSRVFRVEFAIDLKDSRFEAAKKAAITELNFFLVEKGEKDPWAYMRYHCGTASNIYSSIHWEFHIGTAPDGDGT